MRTQYTLGLLWVYGVRRNKFKTYGATPVTRSPSVLLTLTISYFPFFPLFLTHSLSIPLTLSLSLFLSLFLNFLSLSTLPLFFFLSLSSMHLCWPHQIVCHCTRRTRHDAENMTLLQISSSLKLKCKLMVSLTDR